MPGAVADVLWSGDAAKAPAVQGSMRAAARRHLRITEALRAKTPRIALVDSKGGYRDATASSRSISTASSTSRSPVPSSTRLWNPVQSW